jgi:hypothetical protein
MEKEMFDLTQESMSLSMTKVNLYGFNCLTWFRDQITLQIKMNAMMMI